MIEQVTINDLGVIERAELGLHPGFNVVTGETGAGKTMVVTALGLLLGARAEATAVRSGAARASVDAELALAPSHPAMQQALEAGVVTEEDLEETGAEAADAEVTGADAAGADGAPSSSCSLLLGRAVSAKGRSRASVAGRPVPVAVLGGIGAELVTVHGQSDQIRLKSAATQRAALDRYAGGELAAALQQYQQGYRRYIQDRAELEEITSNELERRREAEHLQQALEAIDAVEPVPGEDAELKAESLKLENLESLREAARAAQAALAGADEAEAVEPGPNAVERVESALAALTAEADQDEQLGQVSRQISEISALLTDAAAELGGYVSELDDSGPERLAEVHQRRAQIDRILRLYGPEITDVLAWAAESRSRLDTLHSDEDRIAELTAAVQDQQAQLWTQAEQLRGLRRAAGERLSVAVGAELAELSMPHARLEVVVDAVEDLGPQGADTVSFLLSPHAGAHALPLGKGASGGELSRIMLALEVVLASYDAAATFIFDEVDAGVGGKAAAQIGRRLALLAQHAQVIVVTHLPQVAAHADQHIRVFKTSDAAEGVTASDVRALTEAERVEELARMLAGDEGSAAAKTHAQELIDAAKETI